MKTLNKTLLAALIALITAGLFVVTSQALGSDDEEEDGGTIVFTQPVKAVIFEHSIHMDMGLECDSCHDDLFEMATGTAEENEDFTMKSLYDGKYCGACHDGDTAFASNTRCTACHIGVKGYDRMMGKENKGEHEGHH